MSAPGEQPGPDRPDGDPAAGRRAAGLEEERRQLRPYRRFLAVILSVAIVALCGLILRGIIRTLDRLPSTESMQRLEVVDTRALAACAEDLERLELRVRRAGADALGRATPAAAPDDFDTVARGLETERLKVVARCRLDEPRGDPTITELARAAAALESLLRAYALLEQRFGAEGRPDIRELKEALDRARTQLQTR